MSTTIVGEFASTFVLMATMGDRIREERTAKGWSYQELADRVTKAAGIKCKRVTIEKLEARSSRSSSWSLPIAQALGVDHEWLLTGKGLKVQPPSIDKKMRLLTPEDFEFLHDSFDAQIDRALELRRSKRSE